MITQTLPHPSDVARVVEQATAHLGSSSFEFPLDDQETRFTNAIKQGREEQVYAREMAMRGCEESYMEFARRLLETPMDVVEAETHEHSDDSARMRAQACMLTALGRIQTNTEHQYKHLLLRRWLRDVQPLAAGANGSVFNVGMQSGRGQVAARFLAAKTPKSDADMAEMYHEFFIGRAVLNQLRADSPCFMYTLGIYNCDDAACSSPVTTSRVFLAVEELVSYNDNGSVTGPVSLDKFAKECDNLADVVAVLVLLFDGLACANAAFNFTHYDLHSGNVMVKRLKHRSVFPVHNLPGMTAVSSQFVPVVIDFGMAYAQFKDIDDNGNATQGVGMRSFGHFRAPLIGYGNNCATDIFKCLFYLHTKIAGSPKPAAGVVHTLLADMVGADQFDRYIADINVAMASKSYFWQLTAGNFVTATNTAPINHAYILASLKRYYPETVQTLGQQASAQVKRYTCEDGTCMKSVLEALNHFGAHDNTKEVLCLTDLLFVHDAVRLDSEVAQSKGGDAAGVAVKGNRILGNLLRNNGDEMIQMHTRALGHATNSTELAYLNKAAITALAIVEVVFATDKVMQGKYQRVVQETSARLANQHAK